MLLRSHLEHIYTRQLRSRHGKKGVKRIHLLNFTLKASLRASGLTFVPITALPRHLSESLAETRD